MVVFLYVECVGGVAGKQIHFATGQGSKALAGVEVAVLHFAGITKHGSRDGLADIHIKAAIGAIRLHKAEARQFSFHTTYQFIAAVDRGHLLALAAVGLYALC